MIELDLTAALGISLIRGAADKSLVRPGWLPIHQFNIERLICLSLYVNIKENVLPLVVGRAQPPEF